MRKRARLDRLTAIADELDRLELRRQALFAERMRLWISGRDAKRDPSTVVELASASRVKAVTLRLLVKRHEATP